MLTPYLFISFLQIVFVLSIVLYSLQSLFKIFRVPYNALNGAMQVIVGTTTAPGATLTALTAASGDSFQIRNFDPPSRAFILTCWANNNAAGKFRFRSPLLHDSTNNALFPVLATAPTPFLGINEPQPLISGDTLILELSGSAVGGQIETAAMLLYYENLGNVKQKLITPAQMNQYGINDFTVEVDLTVGAAGGYSVGNAINSFVDTFHGRSFYAIRGGVTNQTSGLIGIRGIDTANLRVAFPCNSAQPFISSEFFVDLSNATHIGCIPVFNAFNKAGTIVDTAQTQAGTAVNVSLNLVELDPQVATLFQ